MKFKVTDLGIFGGGSYSTLEEANINQYDKHGRKGNIVIEMTEQEYTSLISDYEAKIQKIETNYSIPDFALMN